MAAFHNERRHVSALGYNGAHETTNLAGRADGNAWLAGGGSGHGFKHGPAMGQHVARRVLGEVAAEPQFALTVR